jgi:hypothetical protein
MLGLNFAFFRMRGREIGNAAPEHQSRSGACFDRGAQLVDRSHKPTCCSKAGKASATFIASVCGERQ